MNKLYFSLATGVFALATVVVSGPVLAESFPPISNPTVKSECGECHMAFFAEMLPQKSWQKIFNELSNHYGEDASIEPALLKEISAFYMRRAADVLNSRGARKWRDGIKKGGAPDRITTAPRFIRKHDESEFKQMWKQLKVTSKADCVACHKDANLGLFDDD